MQSLSKAIEQFEHLTRKGKKSRQEDLKQIKQLYKDLQSKQQNIYDSSVNRVQNNMQNFKQQNFKQAYNGINSAQINQKYEKKLNRIDRQIEKLDEVIKKGVGSIIEKPFDGSNISKVSFFKQNSNLQFQYKQILANQKNITRNEKQIKLKQKQC